MQDRIKELEKQVDMDNAKIAELLGYMKVDSDMLAKSAAKIAELEKHLAVGAVGMAERDVKMAELEKQLKEGSCTYHNNRRKEAVDELETVKAVHAADQTRWNSDRTMYQEQAQSRHVHLQYLEEEISKLKQQLANAVQLNVHHAERVQTVEAELKKEKEEHEANLDIKTHGILALEVELQELLKQNAGLREQINYLKAQPMSDVDRAILTYVHASIKNGNISQMAACEILKDVMQSSMIPTNKP